MINLDDESKLNVLLTILNERYSASHKMRERSTRFALWILGFLIAAGSWLILNDNDIVLGDKAKLTVVTVIVAYFSYQYITDIKRGFDRNWQVIVTIEDALGCFEEGSLIDGRQLYPEKYKHPVHSGLRGHFGTTISLLVVAFVVLELLLWCGISVAGP